MLNRIALIILLNLFFLAGLNYSQTFRTSKNEPADVTAGKSTYRWEIKKLILEISNNVKPVIVQGDTVLQANTIIFDDKADVGYAYGNVIYENKKDKIILLAGEGTYDSKKKEIIARNKPVIIQKKDNTYATSDIMKIYPNRDYVILIGNVRITNTNFTMTGDQANMNQKTGKMKVMGNARTKQGNSFLRADNLDIESKNGKLDSYVALGNVQIEDAKEGYTINSGRLDYFKDLGYSRISQKPVITFTNKNITAYSIIMEKFDKENKANLLGNVIIHQGKRKAYAKWGEYFIKQKKMVLTGNPVLVEKSSRFNSYKINIDIQEETMGMVGKGTGFYEYR